MTTPNAQAGIVGLRSIGNGQLKEPFETELAHLLTLKSPC